MLVNKVYKIVNTSINIPIIIGAIILKFIHDQFRNLATNTENKHMQKYLATSKDSALKFDLIYNKNLHIDVQKIIAKDNNLEVRYWLVKHSNVDPKILFDFISDKDGAIARNAKKNLLNKFEECPADIKVYIVNNLDEFEGLDDL